MLKYDKNHISPERHERRYAMSWSRICKVMITTRLICSIFFSFFLLIISTSAVYGQDWIVSLALHEAYSISDADGGGSSDDIYLKVFNGENQSCNYENSREEHNRHIKPPWICPVGTFSGSDPVAIVKMQLWDYDDWFNGGDDHYDINPEQNARDILMSFKPASHMLAIPGIPGWEQYKCAQGRIKFKGTEGEDFAWVIFTISASPVGALNGDSDNDGLPDAWELCGVDGDGDGDIGVELRSLGADPYRKDLFVEIDWFVDDDGSGIVDHSHEPWLPSLINAWHEFDVAPVANPLRPDGTPSLNGINLHIDVGQLYENYRLDTTQDGIPNFTVGPAGDAHLDRTGRLAIGNLGGGNRICANLNPAPCTITGSQGEVVSITAAQGTNIRKRNFNKNRESVFRYAIFGHHADGWGTASGLTPLGTVDFAVTLGTFPQHAGIRGPSGLPVDGEIRQHTGTFMHELGHSLGIGHGGSDALNFKPNYLSIMSYWWQMRGLFIDTNNDLIADPIMGIDYDGDGINDGSRFMYSNETLPTLNENCLNEQDGIGNGQIMTRHYCQPIAGSGLPVGLASPFRPGNGRIDWDCDNIPDPCASVNVNGDWQDANNNDVPDVGELPIFSNLTGFNDYRYLSVNKLKGITKEEDNSMWGDVKRLIPLPDLQFLVDRCESTQRILFEEFQNGTRIDKQYIDQLGIPVLFLRDTQRTPMIEAPHDRNGVATQSPPQSLVNKPSTVGSQVPLVIRFKKPQRYVALYLGRSTPGDPHDDRAVMSAFNMTGDLIGKVSRPIPANGVTGFLGVMTAFPYELISRVELRFEGGAKYEPVHIDDLVLCAKQIMNDPGYPPAPKFGDIEINATIKAKKVVREPGHDEAVFKAAVVGVPIKLDQNIVKTDFQFARKEGTNITLTAPESFDGLHFIHWEMNDAVVFADRELSVELTLLSDSTLTALYGKTPPPIKAQVNMGKVDIEDGLTNTHRKEGTDGENAVVTCGPPGDQRKGRSNWGTQDPTSDISDPFIYFNVTDPQVKKSRDLEIIAYVYDDPALPAGTNINLQYTNEFAVDENDFPNVFAVHSIAHTLGQTGDWVPLVWKISDAGFRSLQHKNSDFRIVANLSQITEILSWRICIDGVVVSDYTSN